MLIVIVLVCVGNVRVSYQAVHVGHEHELRFLSLTDDERQYIARLLYDDIPFSKVLDKVRKDLAGPDLERLHLLERVDLKNICRDFGLLKATYHRNDAASVKIWVEKERAAARNDGVECCVRFVKYQGEEDSEWGLGVEPQLDKTTVGHERLGSISFLCIESDVLPEIKFDDIVSEFSRQKGRTKSSILRS